MGKKKKEKIIYVDDGSTVADMSGVKSGPRLGAGNPYRPRPKAREVWKTYLAAVKMMFVPMLIVVCGLIIVYMILSLIFLII